MTYKAPVQDQVTVGIKIVLLHLLYMPLSLLVTLRVSFSPKLMTTEHLSAWMVILALRTKDSDFPNSRMRPNKIEQLIKMCAS